MAASESFANAVAKLQAGDEDAGREVFQRYGYRLIGLARAQFEGVLRYKVDPEDVVQSVYKSFFIRFREGQLQAADWDNLWGLLVMITLRKCANQIKYHYRERRDAEREAPASGPDDSRPNWDVSDPEPTPLEATILTETIEAILRELEPPERVIIELSLQGYTVQEIKEQLGRAERSVRRVRERIRHKLERMQEEA